MTYCVLCTETPDLKINASPAGFGLVVAQWGPVETLSER